MKRQVRCTLILRYLTLTKFPDVKRQMQTRLQELEITSTTSSTIHSGTLIFLLLIGSTANKLGQNSERLLRCTNKKQTITWVNWKLLKFPGPKLPEQNHLVCPFARFICACSELYHTVRHSLGDVEKALSDAVTERNAAEQRLQITEKRIRDLEAKLEEEGRESSDLDMLHKRLSEELEDERKQHLKDLADRDFTTDQTRKKYQGEQGD